MHYALYQVQRALPHLGALPGDALYYQPGDPTHPLQLVRNFDPDHLPTTLCDPSDLLLYEASPGYDPPAVPELLEQCELPFGAATHRRLQLVR